ncbi:MAG: GNAT family acetyltransferase [Clostridiales bacterium]|nr:GNAT family acetyltransferase [Clostridiales bacterium]
MIRREQLSYNYIQKEPLSGSDNGMRFYIQKQGDTMLVTLYPEPFCFVKTPADQKNSREFPNTPEGLDEAVLWMNGEQPHYSR